MKTLHKSLLVAFTLALISVSFAQADLYKSFARHNEVAARNKLKNDPTYSTANHKHPNKVTAARQWNPESGIEFRIRNRMSQDLISYREQQRRGGLGDPAIAIPSKPSFLNRNYKQQNWMVAPQSASQSEVATRVEASGSVGN